MSSKSFKSKLAYSTALFGAAFLLAPLASTPAHAITVGPGSSGAVDLGNGVGLIVTSNGTIAGSTYAVTFSGIATSIDNSGTINTTAGAAIFMNADSMAGGITNSGTIAAVGGSGIYLESASHIGGGITNSGRIYGVPPAINVAFGSTVTGNLFNSGTISSNSANAIVFYSGGVIDGTITNSGTIIASGTAGAGLLINSNAAVSGGIINSGTISSAQAAISIGGNSSVVSGISNSGTITSSGNNGIIISQSGTSVSGGINNTGRINGNGQHGVFITRAAFSGGLTNSGTIQGSFQGVYFNSGASITGNVTNTGTIIGSQGYGFDMEGNSTLTGFLTNSGTITGVSAAVNIQSSPITAIINSGYIAGGSTTGGQRGLNIAGSTTDITGGITNSGTISGYTGIRVSQGSSGDLSGGITNSGTINGIGGLAINFDGLASNVDLVLDGGRLIGNVIDTNSSLGFSDVIVTDDFTTEGDFNVSSFTLTSGALTVSAGDTITSYDDIVLNSEIIFAVDSNASYGQLISTTGAIDFNVVDISVSAASATLTAGDIIKIADGANAITGLAGNSPFTVDDTSALWNFQVVRGDGLSAPTNNTELYLLVQASTTAEDLAFSENNAGAARALDSVNGSSDPILQQITANLNGAPDAQAVNDILESVSPGVDESILTTAKIVAGKTSDLIQSRLGDLSLGRSTGVSSGNLTSGLSFWGQLYGQHASQDERDGIDGYDANTYGVVVGVDSDNIFDHAVIGLALSYGDTSVKSKDVNDTRTDINSYQIGLYGDYELAPSVFINGNVAYGYNDIDSTRHDVGGIAGVNANADTSADQYTAHVEFGKHFAVQEAGAPIITPTVLANYLHLSQDSYTETGAGGANLNVTPDDVNALELGAAVKAKWELKQTDGAILAPSVHAGYRYDVIGDTVAATSNFTGGGASFDTQGADPARHILNTGAGVSYSMANDWTLSASYDFEYKEDYTAHSGIVRAGYKF